MNITNNTLAFGLFLALFLIIGGTWVSLNFIDDLTGAATSGYGSTNVTVTSVVSCSIDDNLISFGEMARGINNDSERISDYFVISNDGNVNLTVVSNASVNLWSSSPAPTSNWRIRCSSTDDGNATCSGTYENIPASGSLQLISGLTPVDGIDSLSIGVNITVPNDEPSGYKNGTILFTCSQT